MGNLVLLLMAVGAVLWLLLLLATNFNVYAVSLGLLLALCLPDGQVPRRS